MALNRDARIPRSSLEPAEGLPTLNAHPVPQLELPMDTREGLHESGAWLRSTPRFGTLTQPEASMLRTYMQVVELSAGDVLLRQGEAGDALFLIESCGL